MSGNNANSEVVLDGWLIKSPPEKRIWRAKWRRRWFILRQSGQIPGQYVLEYYTDQNRRKLKGKIDLDQCEQVDAGLQCDNPKWAYHFMFDIRTPKRIYYLVSASEEDMNKWVDCICQVCGLKMHVDEQVDVNPQRISPITMHPETHVTLPQDIRRPNDNQSRIPDSPGSEEGEPYILMSECVTGKKSVTNGSNHSTNFPPVPPPKGTLTPKATNGRIGSEWYDTPPTLVCPPAVSTEAKQKQDTPTKTPALCDNSIKVSVIPPRPPKPAHLHNYQNVYVKENSFNLCDDEMNYDIPMPTKSIFAGKLPVLSDLPVTLDDMYDYPTLTRDRRKQSTAGPNLDDRPPPPVIGGKPKHSYTNAPATEVLPQYEVVDSNGGLPGGLYLPMNDPLQYTDMTPPKDKFYCNQLSTPLPRVHRDLKPQPTKSQAPVVDRTVKPKVNSDVGQSAIYQGRRKCSFRRPKPSPAPRPNIATPSKLQEPRVPIKQRSPKLPTAINISNRSPRRSSQSSFSEDERSSSTSSRKGSSTDDLLSLSDVQSNTSTLTKHTDTLSLPSNSNTLTRFNEDVIQYLDLDLESDSTATPSKQKVAVDKKVDRVPVIVSSNSTTVYKTVDFVRTKAFNETRQTVEQNYRTSERT